jgi:excisionase family DNA binding protein
MATAIQSASRPVLAELLINPAKVEELSREAIPQLRGELAQLDTLLLARLLAPGQPQTPEDQLLSVEETAVRLGCSQDYLYRHHKTLPFTRRVGRKLLFSAKGIEQHISQKRHF